MVAAVIRQCGNDLDGRREPHGEETLGPSSTECGDRRKRCAVL